ncbi:MAG: hypothetical protein WKF88_09320 [Ferruginibacter sp.]
MFKDLPDGSYSVELDFLDSVIKIPISVAAGVVTVDAADILTLNESFTYTGKVKDTDGATVNIVKDTESYDCFQFSIYPGK